jgi:hypothetical protein
VVYLDLSLREMVCRAGATNAGPAATAVRLISDKGATTWHREL